MMMYGRESRPERFGDYLSHWSGTQFMHKGHQRWDEPNIEWEMNTKLVTQSGGYALEGLLSH